MRKIRNGIAALLLANTAVFNLSSGSVVFSHDFNEETEYGYTEEVSSTFSTNYKKIKYDDAFKTHTTINISGAEYKQAILNNVNRVMGQNNISKSDQYVKLTGLKEITGQLKYTIKFNQPVKTLDLSKGISWSANPEVTLPPSSLKLLYVSNDTAKVEGIEFTFNIKWGEMLGVENECWLPLFESSLAVVPDLSIDITVPGLQFASKLPLNTSVTLYSSVESCTISAGDNLSILYTENSTDSDGYPVSTDKSARIDIDEQLTGLPRYSSSILIAEKREYANSGNSSQNKPSKPSIPSNSNNEIIVLRVYNPKTGEHLFTSNAAERSHLVDNGWKNEYCEWNTPSNSDSPIYRLCNPNTDDHHYTANKAEKDMLVQLGWRDEGVHFYSADKDNGIPVYRMYNPNTTGVGSHHYTSSKAECDALSNYGWNYEGIAWYGILK